MAKLRKMLGNANSPYIISLINAIKTQSKQTICKWCLDYSFENILPLYENEYPNDPRPKNALIAAYDWLDGKIKFPLAKQFILNAHKAAREAEENPSAQAAARAIGQAASSIHMPAHSLGIAFYGSAAVAYKLLGTDKTSKDYDIIASQECEKMLLALMALYIEDEPNPAKINFKC